MSCHSVTGVLSSLRFTVIGKFLFFPDILFFFLGGGLRTVGISLSPIKHFVRIKKTFFEVMQ
jgi:hypothetical protein